MNPSSNENLAKKKKNSSEKTKPLFDKNIRKALVFFFLKNLRKKNTFRTLCLGGEPSEKIFGRKNKNHSKKKTWKRNLKKKKTFWKKKTFEKNKTSEKKNAKKETLLRQPSNPPKKKPSKKIFVKRQIGKTKFFKKDTHRKKKPLKKILRKKLSAKNAL